jgi:hypothetical protein
MLIKNIIGINRQFFDWTRDGKWATTETFVDYDSTYIEDDTLFIRFQGSEDISTTNGFNDMVRNLRFAFKYDPFLKCLVHKGFLEGWIHCCLPILKAVCDAKASKGIKKIVVSGYSQGADIALLCAVYLHKIFEYDGVSVECYAFAPSKIWWCFLSWRVSKYLRNIAHLIIAYGDPVSKIPFTWWGYQHIGIKHMIGSINDKYKMIIYNHKPSNFRLNLLEVKINNNDY